MKLLIAGGFIAAAVATGTYAFLNRQPADVYSMPVEQVYGKLAAVRARGGDGTFIGAATISASGNGKDVVHWTSTAPHSARECTLKLARHQSDAAKTHVSVTCRGGSLSDGAAAGMAHNLFRNAIIEKLDSTLNGRPFDPRRSMGATAASWPDDGVDGSYGTAVKQAIRMQNDFAEMDRRSREAEREESRQREWDEFNGVNDPAFGEPTTGFAD